MNEKQGLGLLYRQKTILYSVGCILTQNCFLSQGLGLWLHCNIAAMHITLKMPVKQFWTSCYDCCRLLDCTILT